MQKISIDLREVRVLMTIRERLHVGAQPGGFRVSSAGLPKGTYEIAQLLAVAGFERFVFRLYVEAAKSRLNLSATDIVRYENNLGRLFSNPAPKVIEEGFGYIGIFDVFDKSSRDDERLRARLGSVIKDRNRVAHGRAVGHFDEVPVESGTGVLIEPDPRDRKEAILELIEFFETVSSRLNETVNARLRGL